MSPLLVLTMPISMFLIVYGISFWSTTPNGFNDFKFYSTAICFIIGFLVFFATMFTAKHQKNPITKTMPVDVLMVTSIIAISATIGRLLHFTI